MYPAAKSVIKMNEPMDRNKQRLNQAKLNGKKNKTPRPEKPVSKENHGLKPRKNWIDGLRGLAMLFVLYGHLAGGWTEYFVFTSAIKIPLFFAITGYVFKVRSGRPLEFIKNLLIKIGIPWVVLTLMPVKVGYQLIKMNVPGAMKTFIKFISGTTYWYMPCCIIAEIIFFFILAYVKKINYVTVVAIAVSACGFIMAKVGTGTFAQFRVACIAQLFMLCGFLFRCFEGKLKNDKSELILGIGCTVVYLLLGILTLVQYPGLCMDVHVCRYYNLPICLVMIVTGIVAVFLAFRRFYTREGILSFIGKNTLVFYMVGSQCKGVTLAILKKLGIVLPKNPFIWALLCLIICLECTAASIILNRWMPELVGKTRRKE